MNGRAAQKLFENMQSTSSGWTQKDFERLFTGYGFTKKEGSKHTLYISPEYSDIIMSVPRHNKLKEWVAREAVKTIEDLNKRNATKENKNG